MYVIKANQHSMEGHDYDIPFQEKPLKDIYSEYSHKHLSKMLQSEVVDRALGCLFGSFIGDALGAFLEFSKEKFNDQLLTKAMTMPGGGHFNIRPGQVTDDSELAFHLLKSFTTFNVGMPLEDQIDDMIVEICRGYVSWFQSRPFDMGETCRNGIKQIIKLMEDPEKNPKKSLPLLYQNVDVQNCDSESNGSLMRITPIPFFCALLPKKEQKSQKMVFEKLKELTIGEIKLTHSNETAVKSSLIWSFALRSLISRKDNNEIKEILKKILQLSKQNGLSRWVDEVVTKEPMDTVQQMGWAKIAWSYGFRYLKHITLMPEKQWGPGLFKQYIRDIISRGGDTDTNAAICGGMLGAVLGFKNLPKEYLKKMMELTFPPQKKIKTDRTAQYEPRTAFLNAYKIMQMFIMKKANQSKGKL